MMVVVFYATEGSRAKMFAREIESSKTDLARVCDVTVWDGKPIKGCDYVHVMSDVPDWQRKRIEATYGPLTSADEPSIEQRSAESSAETSKVEDLQLSSLSTVENTQPLNLSNNTQPSNLSNNTQLSLLDQTAESPGPETDPDKLAQLEKRSRARQKG